MPDIGVVTVTYNSGAVIDDFMRSALAQSYGSFTLYLIDNASTDDTLERIAAYDDPRIIVIPNKTNVGVAAGNNQGIEHALGAGCRFVLLINNDTEFEPSLYQILADGLVEHTCDMISPKIMHFDKPNRIWCAGGYFQPSRAWAGLHYGENQIDRGQFDVARRVNYSPTCCLLVTRRVFDIVGLMDEDYFVYCDDTDFCFRAMKRGIKMFYEPRGRLLHKVSSLTKADSDFTVRYASRNRALFACKNLTGFGRTASLWFLRVRILLRRAVGLDSQRVSAMRLHWFREGIRFAAEHHDNPPRMAQDDERIKA